MHLAAASNRSGKAFGSITRLLNPDDDRIFRASQNVVGDFLKRVVLSRIEGISGGLHGSAHILRCLLLTSLQMQTRPHLVNCSLAVAQAREGGAAAQSQLHNSQQLPCCLSHLQRKLFRTTTANRGEKTAGCTRVAADTPQGMQAHKGPRIQRRKLNRYHPLHQPFPSNEESEKGPEQAC